MPVEDFGFSRMEDDEARRIGEPSQPAYNVDSTRRGGSTVCDFPKPRDHPTMPTVRFFREDVTCDAEPGETLRELAIRAGVQIYRSFHVPLNCKGKGKCGSCRIELSQADNVRPAGRTPCEVKFLARKFSDPGTRLACQIEVIEDVSVLTQEVRSRKVETRGFIPRGF